MPGTKNYSDLTLKEFKQAREKLDKDIEKLLFEFNEETGLFVQDINVDTIGVSTMASGSDDELITQKINTMVEL